MISATSIPITSTSFHFISQLNHKRGRPPSKPWKLTLGFCIFFIITSFIGYTGHAQSSQCGTVEVLTNLPTPDCTLGSYDQLCIRTKMHFLNNTNGEMDSPEDKYFLNLLSQINEVFLGYKIHLTFDYNCINRSDIGPISSASEISYLISQNDPDVEYDSNSINLYFLQDGASISIGSYANKHLVSKLDDFGLIIHELGHVLGLRHTFPGTGNIVAIDLYCKNPLATYDPPIDHLIRCEHLDDRICDTGLDPFNFDLDGDTIRDGFKWIDINTCEQKPELTPSFADGCGDDTTSWDIPVRNFMSYYTACRSEFTPCQYGTIHEQMLLKPEVIMDCEEDPYDPALSVCSDPDITISTITTWTNELIELCPGQKIIITPCGHLTLDNTTITRKETSIVNELCPNLNYEQLWDGIYLEGEGDYIIIEGALLSKG